MIRFTRSQAIQALERYNRKEVTDLDRRARQIFSDGLGRNIHEVAAQIGFVLNEYGGARGGNVSSAKITAVAQAIENFRPSIEIAFQQAGATELYVNDRTAILAFQPFFVAFEPLRAAGSIDHYTAFAKCLHHLRPDSFPIHTNWIGCALDVPVEQNSDLLSYADFVHNFMAFMDQHHGLIVDLEAVDRGLSWSRIKLFDKVLLCRRAAGFTQTASSAFPVAA